MVLGESIGYYIGCTDREEEGVWHWLDGRVLDYSNWGSEQPNNLNGNENYGDIRIFPDNSDWSDKSGTGKKQSICEKKNVFI